MKNPYTVLIEYKSENIRKINYVLNHRVLIDKKVILDQLSVYKLIDSSGDKVIEITTKEETYVVNQEDVKNFVVTD